MDRKEKHFDFKLFFGDKQIGVCTKRPELYIEELPEEIGGTIYSKPGKHSSWLPMEVKLEEFWLDKADLFLRIYRGATLCETWSLIGCQMFNQKMKFDSVYYIPNL